MTCDRYFELLSARLDRELTGEEAQELEQHRAGCAECRMAEAQLEELQRAFAGLEEVPAPEGFTQGVMDRIRAEEPKKGISLVRRPQFRALAGLAACLVLAAGLYSASCPQPDRTDAAPMVRSFSQSPEMQDPTDTAALEDIPQITAYAAPDEDAGKDRAQKADSAPAGDAALAELTLTLDRLPQGEAMEELQLIQSCTLPDEEGHVCLFTSLELLEQAEQLAREQGIRASRIPGPQANGCYVIVLSGEAD